MGSTTFEVIVKGDTAEDAFAKSREIALMEYGNRGYTGTIAEKTSFLLIEAPEGVSADDYADELIERCDPRIDDKWGTAGCIQIKPGEFLFFGWASE